MDTQELSWLRIELDTDATDEQIGDLLVTASAMRV